MYQIKIKALILTCVALLLAGGAACTNTGTGAGGAADTKVAATVNGRKIMMSEVDRLLNQQTNNQPLSPLELAQGRLQVLDGLIRQEVLFQRAEKEKVLPTDDEVNQAISSLKQQNNMTEEEFQRRLQERGQTEQGVREEVRRQLALEKLQNKVAGNIGAVREKEVDDFYEANKAQFVNRRGVSLAAIIVDPNDNGAQDDAKSEAEATAKANQIYEQIRNGADFATVARARSEDPSNLRGGDIGFIPEDQMKQAGFPPELIARFFSMNAGDVTQPIPISGRLTIFKLQNKRLENENLTKENPQVRDQIKQALINERKSLLNAVMVAVAMNEADVVNNLARGVLDNPGDLSGMRPANAPGAGENSSGSGNAGATASPGASPALTSSPATTASPAASASPQR